MRLQSVDSAHDEERCFITATVVKAKKIHHKILRMLGRIEGELIEIRKLSARVGQLEQWQSWLKGGWAVLAIALAYYAMAVR